MSPYLHEGDTGVYAELFDFSVAENPASAYAGSLPLKVMMNVGAGSRCFACLPNEERGLARLEFIYFNRLGVIRARCWSLTYPGSRARRTSRELMKGYDRREFTLGRLRPKDRHPRRRFLSETGDRASVGGLQIERIRQPQRAAERMSR